MATVQDGQCTGVAIDSEFVYFGAVGSVGKVGLDGGAVTVLAFTLGNQNHINGRIMKL